MIYDLTEHQAAIERAANKLIEASKKHEVMSCLVIRCSKEGGYSYSFTGNNINAYTWIGFLEEMKLEFLQMIEG